MAVLIVDDSDSIRLVVALVLKKAGYEVIEAEDGVVALEKLDKHSEIELVLLDFQMPRKNGLETILEIREKHPFLPVILCSGAPQSDDFRETGLQVQAILRKPFGKKDLLKAVESFL